VIRLAIITDVRFYGDGLSQILGRSDGIEVVLTSPDWRTALTFLPDSRPDVVLLDVSSAEARAALRELAASTSSARLVALGVTDEDADIVLWAEAGVAGYVTRDNSLDDLVEVIVCVSRDEMPCSPRAAGALLRHVAILARDKPEAAGLTTRELQIVRLIERGLSNKEIGRQLCIELTTVKNHVHNILSKLEVDTRHEAVAHVRKSVGVA
jgi:two-component system nitrate/nitrite response regulator NarL